MDEQHIESDPICSAFPDDMRRVMGIYSNLPAKERQLMLRMVEAFDHEDS